MKILIAETEHIALPLLQKSSLSQRYRIERLAEQPLEGTPVGSYSEQNLSADSQPTLRAQIFVGADVDLIVIDADWTAADDPSSRLDGVWLCQQLRVQGISTFILLLTPPNANQGVLTLEAGASDYLTKPFTATALISRVTYLLQRNQVPNKRNRARLLAEITDAIHQTLELKQILQTAVTRLRSFLQADRVLVFRFNPDWQGIVEAESVALGWLKTLGMTIQDSCFNEQYVKSYSLGRISVIVDIDALDVSPCYVEMLRSLQVKANLVVPIVQENHLWGLLIAHQCGASRQWAPQNTQLLQRVATQLGIAIQQAELYQTTHRELVERRRVQQALQASEERFRSLSAFAPVGIYQTDLNGQCIYTNAKWQEIAGLTLEESLGDSWTQSIHPNDREKVFKTWTRFVAGDSDFSLEFRFLKEPEQEERWVFGRAIAIQSPTGETIGYVGVNEDITARKRAEHTIREQAALIDIATDAIFVRDLAGRILFWSKGASQMYGWSQEEAIGQTVQLLLKTQANIDPEVTLSTAIEQGFWKGELTHKTQSGKAILVASRWTLVRDETGLPHSFLEVNTDITEKKQLETQFYQAQRLESLGQLAGGVAHDLGNILTPILGIAQLLRITLKDLSEPTQEQIEILERSAKRGVTMVQKILTFAQGSPDDGSTVDVTTLLQEVIDMARQGIPNNIEIRQNIFTENPSNSRNKTVRVNATHLHQVFMNLCINARDAMPKGGVLTLSVENTLVEEASVSKYLDRSVGQCFVGHYVTVTVADTGVGIEPALRDRIFDPFFTTKGPDEGTGLGLATVIGIVKNAGGFLQVFSEVGQGTKIKVYFPVVYNDSQLKADLRASA
ncbi:MAG: PAS domain S-box protein [Cyanobacteria bacterium J06650_10]